MGENIFARFLNDKRATPPYESMDESSMSSFIDDDDVSTDSEDSRRMGNKGQSDSDDNSDRRVTRSSASKKKKVLDRRRHRRRRSPSMESCEKTPPPSTSRATRANSSPDEAVSLLGSGRKRFAKIQLSSPGSAEDDVSPTKKRKTRKWIQSDSEEDEEQPNAEVDLNERTAQLTSTLAREDANDAETSGSRRKGTPRASNKDDNSDRRITRSLARNQKKQKKDLDSGRLRQRRSHSREVIEKTPPPSTSRSSRNSTSPSDQAVCPHGSARKRSKIQRSSSGSDGDEKRNGRHRILSDSGNEGVEQLTSTQEGEDPNDELDPDYPMCSICDKRYTFSKDHRAVSLKCGHFFGKPCIKKWIEIQRKCPTCRGPAVLDDLREHRGDTIKESARDEVAALEKLNRKQAKTIRRLERENQQYAEAHDKCEAENDTLKEKVTRLSSDVVRLKREVQDLHVIGADRCRKIAERSGRILFEHVDHKYFVPRYDSQARAFDFDGEHFAIGYRTRVDAFSIHTGAWRDDEYVAEGKSEPFHDGQIRFLVYSPDDPTKVLSGGEDRKAVVHDLGHCSSRREFEIPNRAQAWSGCWISSTEIAVGTIHGRVWTFNIEESQTQMPKDITDGYGHSPVIFLEKDEFTNSLLVGTFKNIYAIKGSSTINLVSCDTENFNQIRSIAWNHNRRMMAVTFRGGKAASGMTHKLYELKSFWDGGQIKAIEAKEISRWATPWQQCTTLWSNCLLSLENEVLFVVFNEDRKHLVVHDFLGNREDAFLEFDSNQLGNPSMMKVLVESEETLATLFVLSSRAMSTYSVEAAH